MFTPATTAPAADWIETLEPIDPIDARDWTVGADGEAKMGAIALRAS
jgi:hypothetical protein